MDESFRLWPEQASNLASEVDALNAFMLLISTIFTVGIAGAIIYFAIKYRRGSPADRSPANIPFRLIETTWIVVPLILTMIMFAWGAYVYFQMARPPAGALKIDVVGRQWMWKFQHPEGNSEINELHVPLGRAVQLSMISEDVIHALYIPAFRVKHDVLPGRYTSLWFEATRPGRYWLFCAEYCGSEHAKMIGRVVVLEPHNYEQWLSGVTAGLSPVEAGRVLFEQLRCDTCHQGGGVVSRGPPLEGLFGSEVKLRDGTSVIADRDYLRESILRPAAKVVAGYEPIMPSFEGQIDEEGLNHLIDYLQSLSTQRTTLPQPTTTEP